MLLAFPLFEAVLSVWPTPKSHTSTTLSAHKIDQFLTFQPSVGNRDIILERMPSNKEKNTPSNGPPPVIHKQVCFVFAPGLCTRTCKVVRSLILSNIKRKANVYKLL